MGNRDASPRVTIGSIVIRCFEYERMVAFWSNHFTVSSAKRIVGPAIPAYEREAIRPFVFGRFADMLKAVVRHPAMLAYLDNHLSMGENSPAGRRRRSRLGLEQTEEGFGLQRRVRHLEVARRQQHTPLLRPELLQAQHGLLERRRRRCCFRLFTHAPCILGNTRSVSDAATPPDCVDRSPSLPRAASKGRLYSADS